MLIPQNKEIISATNLFIFNPEHDLALAVGNNTYTPPAEVVKIKKDLALLPAIYAGNSDFILVPDSVSFQDIHSQKFWNIAHEKELQIIHYRDLPDHSEQITRIHPWGWDSVIREALLNNGISPENLPSEGTIKNIRNLSHRKTTIQFRERMADILGGPVINPPTELFSLAEVEAFLATYPIAYFKAPWSSSGRGIVVSDHITHKGLLEWAHGVIRKQGSVMAEETWSRVFDFATEWWICKGEAYFLGFSVFKTSSRGKYHGNMEASQSELLSEIIKYAPDFGEPIIEAQKECLNQIIAPGYSGPAGIDMLVDKDGLINPCVEINLRFTMGLINLNLQRFFNV